MNPYARLVESMVQANAEMLGQRSKNPPAPVRRNAKPKAPVSPEEPQDPKRRGKSELEIRQAKTRMQAKKFARTGKQIRGLSNQFRKSSEVTPPGKLI